MCNLQRFTVNISLILSLSLCPQFLYFRLYYSIELKSSLPLKGTMSRDVANGGELAEKFVDSLTW
jgi:hypothetical protein